MEEKVLRALCQGTPEGSLRELGRAALRDYQWREPAHGVIFHALMALPSESLETIRSRIPSVLTRMGFPELDWEILFVPLRLGRTEGEHLIERLLATAVCE